MQFTTIFNTLNLMVAVVQQMEWYTNDRPFLHVRRTAQKLLFSGHSRISV
jgi:hypothetical protein